MTSMTDMNIVLGQGDAVKEVHGARRQNLGMNQQAVPQEAAARVRRQKQKIQAPETDKGVYLRREKEKKDGEEAGYDQQGSREKNKEEDGCETLEVNRIDIMV